MDGLNTEVGEVNTEMRGLNPLPSHAPFTLSNGLRESAMNRTSWKREN